MKPKLIFLLLLSVAVAFMPLAAAWAYDPLPSWSEGNAKKAIMDFVKDVTTDGRSTFVAPAERIAVFDNDGTLWAEQPMYVQIVFALDRVAPTGEFSSPEDIGDLYLHPTPLDLLNLPLAVSTTESSDITQPGQSARTRDLTAPQELIRIRDIADVRAGYLAPPNGYAANSARSLYQNRAASPGHQGYSGRMGRPHH